MIGIWTLVQVYVAILIVIVLHEYGHGPTKGIKIKLFPPYASATSARWRLGGLLVNVAIFILVFNYKPDNFFIQLIGAIAWLHFIFYAIFGSIIPEPIDLRSGYSFFDNNGNKRFNRGERIVNWNTYVFDDVDNNYWYIWIPFAILTYLSLNSYYLPIIKSVLGW